MTEKYGGKDKTITSPFGVQEIRDGILDAWEKEHGYRITSPMQIPQFRKKALSHKNTMTKPEKKFNDFLLNNGHSYEYSYESNGKNFDFAVFKNGSLDMLIEIDGLYYHGLTEDYNGKHVRGETDHLRYLKVTDGTKFIVCDEDKIDLLMNDFNRLFSMEYGAWLAELILEMPTEFPYPVYDEKRLLKDLKHLIDWDYHKNSEVGMSLVRAIYGEAIYGKYEQYWTDEWIVEQVLNHRLYCSKYSSQPLIRQIENIFGITYTSPIAIKNLSQSFL